MLKFSVVPLLLAACSEAPAPVEMPPPSVSVATVDSRTVQIHREFIGRTDATARVEIRARVSGVLEERRFAEGAAVSAGDLLYRIESDGYAAAVAQAEAQVESERARVNETGVNLRRMEQLGVNRSVSEQDVDEARAAAQVASAGLKGAEAALQRARLDLEYTTITAPVGGQISETRIDTGNLVGPDSGVLATIVALDPIHVHFTVSDIEYLDFRRRQLADGRDPADGPALAPALRLADGIDYPHPGRFELAANEIDPGTGTLTLRAAFPNPEQLLRPGQFVTVVFDGDTEQQSLVVPQQAVLANRAGRSVLVVGDDSTVEQRNVVLGDALGDAFIVESGLEPGERVVVRGLQKVRPGMTVTVDDAQ